MPRLGRFAKKPIENAWQNQPERVAPPSLSVLG